MLDPSLSFVSRRRCRCVSAVADSHPAADGLNSAVEKVANPLLVVPLPSLALTGNFQQDSAPGVDASTLSKILSISPVVRPVSPFRTDGGSKRAAFGVTAILRVSAAGEGAGDDGFFPCVSASAASSSFATRSLLAIFTTSVLLRGAVSEVTLLVLPPPPPPPMSAVAILVLGFFVVAFWPLWADGDDDCGLSPPALYLGVLRGGDLSSTLGWLGSARSTGLIRENAATGPPRGLVLGALRAPSPSRPTLLLTTPPPTSTATGAFLPPPRPPPEDDDGDKHCDRCSKAPPLYTLLSCSGGGDNRRVAVAARAIRESASFRVRASSWFKKSTRQRTLGASPEIARR